jgi:putative oxidoreductase
MNVFVSLHQGTDLGLLALRLVIGAIFLVHGSQKRGMWKMQANDKLPAWLLNVLRLLSICEPLGGIALVTGFLTQLAALGLGIIMLGAINLKARTRKVPFAPRDQAGWEFDLMILGGVAALFFAGAGTYSLDRLWFGF